jgi:hypothetical protein
MLLVQRREEIAFPPSDNAVLLNHRAMDILTECNVLMQGRWEVLLLTAVTAVLLHHNAMVIWTDCSGVSTG